MTTKERILLEALKLFSQFGYEAVSVEQIAKAVGIKAPSLYKHYKSKQHIFDAIFDEMQKRFAEQTEKMGLHFARATADMDRFSDIELDALIGQVQELVAYSLHEEYVSRFRKLLTIEQFRTKELSALYTRCYVQRMVDYHEEVFTHLMGNGKIKAGDAHSLALQYVCPILVLMSVCDRQEEKEEQVMGEIATHIKQFWLSH